MAAISNYSNTSRLSSLLLCLLSLLPFSTCHTLTGGTLIKSERLTPFQTSSNGARIFSSYGEVEASTSGTWDIQVNSQRLWHFIILVDNTWGFDTTGVSSMKVTVESTSVASATTFDNLLFGFTVDNTRYISSSIAMNNDGDNNQIYPNCASAPQGQEKGFGNIASLPSSDRGCDIAAGTCANWKSMFPQNGGTSGAVETNAFPITWTLTNDPITDTLEVAFDSDGYSSTFTQHCDFTAFPSGEGLKIYVAGNDVGQKLSISAFTIESVWATPLPTPVTTAPTKTPTRVPTKMPSKSPSKAPTNVPSKTPTGVPSTSPSDAPTTSPSVTPSNAPTSTPTNAPSNAPSFTPSDAPSTSPSVAPTPRPTIGPTRFPTAPTRNPSVSPSRTPTVSPTPRPSQNPTTAPTPITASPSMTPSQSPSNFPSTPPTKVPSNLPSTSPTPSPTTLSPTTGRPSTSPTTLPPTVAIQTQIGALRMDGNFAETESYLAENGKTLDSFGREAVRYFINPTNHRALDLIEIEIIGVYSGSVVIEHSLTVLETDAYLLEAARTNVETSVGAYYADASGGRTWQLMSYEFEAETTSSTATPTLPFTGDIVQSQPTPNPTATAINPQDTSQDLAELDTSTSFGDLYLPLILVVVIATCTLLSVVLVIIRQFCHKARRRGSDKLRGYESVGGLQLYRRGGNVRGVSEQAVRGSIDLTNPDHMLIRQQQEILDDLHNADGALTTPYKKGRSRINGRKSQDTHSFSHNLSNIAGVNGAMVDDIVDDMGTRHGLNGHRPRLNGASSARHSSRSKASSKRSQHKRTRSSKSRKALQYMMAYAEPSALHEGSVSSSSPSPSETEVTQEHTGPHEFPYQNITSSQLGHFQNAIENATTQSDFEKLENCIKHGQIPRRQNQHRMEVALATASETTMMLHSARDGVKGDPAEHHHEAAAPDPASVIDPAYYVSESPYKMRQASDTTTKSGYAGLPNMEARGVNKHNLMVLDEEELERKLVRVAKQQNHQNGNALNKHSGPGHLGQHRVLSPAPMFKTVSISPINRTYISDMENLTSQEVSATED